MKGIQIRSLKNQQVIAEKCLVVEYFIDRLRGLIGRTDFRDGEGMLFPRCQSVHTWWMRIPIDVVFLRKQKNSSQWEVSSVRENVKPWKLSPLFDWRATDTLEVPAGTVSRYSIATGDELCSG